MPAEPQPSAPASSRANRRNVAIFALLCAAVAAGIVAYALHSRSRMEQRANSATGAAPIEDAAQLAEVQRKPYLMFRSTALGPGYGQVTVVALDGGAGARYVTKLSCDRVYGTRRSGVCLQASRGVLTTYHCVSFDENFEVRHTFNLAGIPSRTRVSHDGRLGAVTVFVSGDSYSAAGFSTRSTLLALNSTNVIGDLEEFAVRKDGQPFKAVDFNYWGITFAADGDRFYATLSTGGKMYLVEGHIAKRELIVLREGVECPSLSPDGTRVVYKSRTTDAGRLVWRLRVLNLKTQNETLLGETRSVDDQTEWLDDEQVLYALPRGVAGSGSMDVWAARADGTGTPRLFVADASSPCVVRP